VTDKKINEAVDRLKAELETIRKAARKELEKIITLQLAK
jgi:molecular chaperone GrpE (heat shock protein)